LIEHHKLGGFKKDRVFHIFIMFPPVDSAVLQNNPDFALLHAKLTNVVLNPDGSTKDDPHAKERAAVDQVSKLAIVI
jgi:hypothetical protein